MGEDKQMLNYKGHYLIDSIVENLSSHFEEIIVVSNEMEFLKNRYASYENNIIIISDIIKDMGPCAGLYSGLVSSSNEDNFLIACDMPYFNHAYVDFLLSKSYEKALVYKNGKYLEPFFALYKKDLVNDLKKYLASDKRSLNGFLKEITPNIVTKEDAGNIKNLDKTFRNLNYPGDWQEYLEEKFYGSNEKI